MEDMPSPMFPFDQTDPQDQFMSFQQYQTADQQNYDLILQNPVEYGSDLMLPKASNSFAAAINDEDNNTLTDKQKKRKIMHKELERQRREEMSKLYISLRSLIPLHYIKGKRSMSDHMQEAMNYIKDLQIKIQELSEKRDGLQRLSNSSALESECSQNLNPEDSVTVRPCLAGVEVFVSTCCRKGLPLSQVLAVLIEEGLTIVNCISTKMNERLLHMIETEVNDGRTMDLLELQQKIKQLTAHL